MSFKLHLFWRTIMLGLIILCGWFFIWGFIYEMIVWEKGLFEAFLSSWWNWLGLFITLPLIAFVSYLDDLIDEEEKKNGRN